MLESGPTYSHVAKPLQCLSLTVHVFRTASEEYCKRGCGQVCAKLCCWMSWFLKFIRMITAMCVSSTDLLSIHYTQEFNMVTQRTSKTAEQTIPIKTQWNAIYMTSCQGCLRRLAGANFPLLYMGTWPTFRWLLLRVQGNTELPWHRSRVPALAFLTVVNQTPSDFAWHWTEWSATTRYRRNYYWRAEL